MKDLPIIKDSQGEKIFIGDEVEFFHSDTASSKFEMVKRKVIDTGHNIDTANNLIHTLLRTNLGWRTAYDTKIVNKCY